MLSPNQRVNNQLKKVGLLGCGVIGARIGAAAQLEGFAEVAFVHSRDRARAAKLFPRARWLADAADVPGQAVDLVIEAATPDVMRSVVLDVLAERDMLAFTLTGLADDDLRSAIRARCSAAKTRLFVPHGGILGLDGISDGRSELDSVSITTTKSPKSLGLSEGWEPGVVYDGPTRGACRAFPRNVNVHAALALCGIGFDRTRSVVIADPATGKNGHVIEVKGRGLEWRLEIESPAGTGVTGAYTPVSGVSTTRRILSSAYDIVLA
jgi:aspartate dehydrogenase